MESLFVALRLDLPEPCYSGPQDDEDLKEKIVFAIAADLGTDLFGGRVKVIEMRPIA